MMERMERLLCKAIIAGCFSPDFSMLKSLENPEAFRLPPC